jgi:hypothetical protein
MNCDSNMYSHMPDETFYKIITTLKKKEKNLAKYIFLMLE